MSSVNKAIIVGRLGQDPEVRYTGDGTPVCNLSVATSRTWRDNSGERQERTEWHRVSVWGDQAEQCAKYLEKGRLVYVEGRLQTNKWTDNQGNDRQTTEIRAFTVQFLGSRGDIDQPAETSEDADAAPAGSGSGGSGGGAPAGASSGSGGSSGGAEASGGQSGGDSAPDMDPSDPGQEPMEKSDFFNRQS